MLVRNSAIPRRRTPSRRIHLSRETRTLLAGNSPALLIIGALGIAPLAYALWLSFQDYQLTRPNDTAFVGLGNYLKLLDDPTFWESLSVTLVVVIVSVVATTVLGLVLALILDTPSRARPLLRVMVLIPWAIPPIVNAMMWKLSLNPDFGVVNGLLRDLGLISINIGWFSSGPLALSSILMASIWNALPLSVIPLLAGLQAVPRELHEAAITDGATPWNDFRHVTLPFLAGPLLLTLILQTMVSFKLFELIYTLTFGGPGTSTSVLAWQTYRITFAHLDIGMGAAWSYTIGIAVLILTIVYSLILYRRQIEH